MILAALLLLAAPARAAAPDVPALISRAAALVEAQRGKTADEARVYERKLEALDGEARRLGPTSAAALAAVAADAAKPSILRLWMVLYLESLDDPEAFPHLKRLLLDPSQPELVRAAAARALAGAPVSPRARRAAFCTALAASPGRQTLRETLFALRKLGCDDAVALEGLAAGDPAWNEAAVAALARTPSPSAVPALLRLFGRFKTGSPERLRVLEALGPHAASLPPARARELVSAEVRSPVTAPAALRLLASRPDPESLALAGRLLSSRDGAVVVGAAEVLAAAGAKERAGELRDLCDGFVRDERFAQAPGRDAVALYDRLRRALARLEER